MELAFVGISLREAIVNQVSSARMGGLVSGFSTALNAARPALHLIHTGFTDPQPIHPWLLANAALESRAHPHIRFNPAVSGGGQFDIGENAQPGDDWASGEFSYAEASGDSASMDLNFTFADYCLLKPDLAGHFRKVPLDCDSEDLVPVSDFLNDPNSEGRSVPFVWSVDAKGVLQKLAISRELAFACRDRLGFWRNLQSMSGIHNYYVDKAIEQVREEERDRAQEEIEALSAAHAEELDGQRASATEDVMMRLTDVLLGMDLSGSALARAPSASPSAPSAPADTTPEAEPESEEAAADPEPEEDEEELSFDEPWIDSMLCTSCDDCLALNKLMFVYNGDKQATIKDPKAGTYAQLVQAAELCPAKCIHPGKPLDPNEPGLDELIKRAEPFN
jgi:ferredoxin